MKDEQIEHPLFKFHKFILNRIQLLPKVFRLGHGFLHLLPVSRGKLRAEVGKHLLKISWKSRPLVMATAGHGPRKERLKCKLLFRVDFARRKARSNKGDITAKFSHFTFEMSDKLYYLG